MNVAPAFPAGGEGPRLWGPVYVTQEDQRLNSRQDIEVTDASSRD